MTTTPTPQNKSEQTMVSATPGNTQSFCYLPLDFIDTVKRPLSVRFPNLHSMFTVILTSAEL